MLAAFQLGTIEASHFDLLLSDDIHCGSYSFVSQRAVCDNPYLILHSGECNGAAVVERLLGFIE